MTWNQNFPFSRNLARTALAMSFVLAFALFCGSSPAQDLALPECDIFLFDLIETDGQLSLSPGKNITDRVGYDNQPWFTPGGKSILFTANYEPDRTDVFEYFIGSEQIKQVTDTPDQEYSPQSSPDNKSISYVTDGASANQSIWMTPREQKEQTWVLENLGEREPVGYYSWNRQTDQLLYWSRYGFCVKLVDLKTNNVQLISGDTPPSTPRIRPDNKRFTFLHQQKDGQVWIKELDPETRAVRPLAPVSGTGRNYDWTPNGGILMPAGDQLLYWVPEGESVEPAWQPIANLDKAGLANVTRIAVSPDGKQVAIVGQSRRTAETAKGDSSLAVITGQEDGWAKIGFDDFVNINCTDETFSAKDDLIVCNGDCNGGFRLKQQYTNFELAFEWRHMRRSGNAGIFIWGPQKENDALDKGQLPQGIEIQILDHGYAEDYEKQQGKKPDWFTTHGDIFPCGIADMKPFEPSAPNGKRSFPKAHTTKGVGQWNRYYIRAINGEVRLWVNGTEVSGGRDCKPASGYIVLEAEGAPVEYRNFQIRVLP